MTTQVQVRGAATATQSARTLASRELDVDTTAKRLNVHDGSTVGGVAHVNSIDDQNNTFTYAPASGTNALTVTLARAPDMYMAGQSFTFKAASTNTGAVTINVNSLGAKAVHKIDTQGGTTVNVVAGEIIAGGVYQIHYDGTNFIIELGGSGGGLVQLGEYTASSGSFIDITGVISSAYDSYKIVIDYITGGSSGGDVYVRTSSDGVTFDSGSTAYSYLYEISSSATSNTQDARIRLAPTSASGGSYSGEINLYAASNPSAAPKLSHHLVYGDAQSTGWGRRRSTSNVLAVQIGFTVGNISDAKIKIYGYG